MRYLVSAMLIVAAIIHLLPLSGVLGGARLSALYGIAFDDPTLAILMRHRAVLFGLLGAFLLLAAFQRTLQLAAFIAAFLSVSSFLYFAWSLGGYNAQVGRVVVVDLIAVVCLTIGAAAYVYQQRNV